MTCKGLFLRPWTTKMLCMLLTLTAFVLLGCPTSEKKHPPAGSVPPSAEFKQTGEKEREVSERPVPSHPKLEAPLLEEQHVEKQPSAEAEPPVPAEKPQEITPPEAGQPESSSPPETAPKEKETDLGEPLVDDPQQLQRLDPVQPVWVDRAKKCVVVQGRICQNNAPLEMFACLQGTKEHEAIVAVPAKAFIIHAGLLAVGAKPGRPVQFIPEYVPAGGTEIEVIVRWKNEQGEVQTVRAQEWIRDVRTGKALEHPWVFGGSGFWRDPETGEQRYQAEGGDFICVANFSTAMLDLPIPSSQSNAELLYQAFTERIPPLGTPVTLLLIPKLDTLPKPAE